MDTTKVVEEISGIISIRFDIICVEEYVNYYCNFSVDIMEKIE